MSKKTITLTNAELLTINNYCMSDEYWQNHNDKVDAKLSWTIRKNRKAIAATIDLIKEAEEEINNEYNTDEKSMFAVDEDGNETQDKVVRPEYEKEYLQKKSDLLEQTQDVEIETVDSEAFFNYNMKDVDWELMSFMINDDEEAASDEEVNE